MKCKLLQKQLHRLARKYPVSIEYMKWMCPMVDRIQADTGYSLNSLHQNFSQQGICYRGWMKLDTVLGGIVYTATDRRHPDSNWQDTQGIQHPVPDKAGMFQVNNQRRTQAQETLDTFLQGSPDIHSAQWMADTFQASSYHMLVFLQIQHMPPKDSPGRKGFPGMADTFQ